MTLIKTPLLRGFGNIEPVFNSLKSISYFAGGFARYCASPCPSPSSFSDVDIFPKSPEAFEVILDFLVSNGFDVKGENTRAIWFEPRYFQDVYVPSLNVIKFTQIGHLKGFNTERIEARELLESFDFTCVQAYILDKNTVMVSDKFLEDEGQKQLKFVSIQNPIKLWGRVLKYNREGYGISRHEVLKALKAWERFPQNEKRMAELDKDGPLDYADYMFLDAMGRVDLIKPVVRAPTEDEIPF
jgi:hypothetical protein